MEGFAFQLSSFLPEEAMESPHHCWSCNKLSLQSSLTCEPDLRRHSSEKNNKIGQMVSNQKLSSKSVLCVFNNDHLLKWSVCLPGSVEIRSRRIFWPHVHTSIYLEMHVTCTKRTHSFNFYQHQSGMKTTDQGPSCLWRHGGMRNQSHLMPPAPVKKNQQAGDRKWGVVLALCHVVAKEEISSGHIIV